jgi:hypothetical protein
VLSMTSLFAAMLSFHNAVARYMFALGRERVLPALGRTHLPTGAPRIALLTQSAIGLAVIVVYALAGWDPTVRLLFWLGTTGAFGVLCLLAVTLIAVIRFFARDPRGENAWRRSPCWPWSGQGWRTTRPARRGARLHEGMGASRVLRRRPRSSASWTASGCARRVRTSIRASASAPTPDHEPLRRPASLSA